MSTTSTEPDAPQPNHRVKYIVTAAMGLIVAVAATVAVAVDAPSRLFGSAPDEDLFSSQRLDSELDVVRARLGGATLRRLDVTSNLISAEAVADDGRLHLYWVRDGELEDMDSISDLHAGEAGFTAADVSAQRIRAAVSDVQALGKPGEIQLASYMIGEGHPLSVAVWIRHDPLSSVLHFDPQGGSHVIREESIETDEHTSSFGGCWC